jgi:hypothetical protein
MFVQLHLQVSGYRANTTLIVSARSLHDVKQSSVRASVQAKAKQDHDEIAFFMRHYSGGVGEGFVIS